MHDDVPSRGDRFEPGELLRKMRRDYWEALARPAEEERGETRLLLSFEVDRQILAARAVSVREVIKVPPWISRVPRSPDHLLGIINLRGQILPVLDVRTRHRGRSIDEGRIVILKGGQRDVGLYVDRVVGLPDVRVDDIQQPQGGAGAVPEEALEGQVEVPDDEAGRDKVADILDVPAFLACEAFSFRQT